MHSLHIEEQTVHNLTALALDIAQRLDNKPGNAVVVCEHSEAVASLVSKKWQQLLRTVKREYASTLDTQKRQELSQKITWMYSRTFFVTSEVDQLETSKTNVLFCMVEALLRYAPVRLAMYVTHPVDHKALHLMTAWMLSEGMVVCLPYCTQTEAPVYTEIGELSSEI